MNIGDVLSKAWKTIWKHKILWIFGIFAGCGTAGTGSGNSAITYQYDVPYEIDYYFNQIDPALIALTVGLIILIALILLVLVIFLSTVGRIGLIRGTYKVHNGAERLTFGEIFSGSTPYFWRVFGLNLLVGILAFVAIVAFFVLGVLGAVFTLGLALLCLIPMLCLLVPAAWLLNIFVQQAIIAIVLEDLGIMEGLRRGWQVFKSNFGDMFITGLILLIITLVFTFLFMLPMMLSIVPFVLGISGGSVGAGVTAAVIMLICYLPIYLVLYGIVRAYTESAWTLNYIRLVPEEVEPVIDLGEPLPDPS